MLRMQLELTQLKQDTERRLAEKDEEMEAQRSATLSCSRM